MSLQVLNKIFHSTTKLQQLKPLIALQHRDFASASLTSEWQSNFYKSGEITGVTPLAVLSRRYKSAQASVKWGSKKSKRNVRLQLKDMSNPEMEVILAPLRALVLEQGNLVRELKLI